MRPFDYINNEPVNLNKESHIATVLERNRILNNAIVDGLSIEKVNARVIIRVFFNCLKCGTFIEEDETERELDIDPTRCVPSLECSCCKTRYIYNRKDEVFELSLKKLKIEDFKQ